MGNRRRGNRSSRGNRAWSSRGGCTRGGRAGRARRRGRFRLRRAYREDQSVAGVAEGASDFVRNCNVFLVLAPGQQSRVNLAQNFIQGQCHHNLVAVASRGKELRRGAAEFSERNLYSPRSQLRQDFLHGNGNRCLAHVGLPDSAFEFEGERAQHVLQRDFDAVSISVGMSPGLRPEREAVHCGACGSRRRFLRFADAVLDRLAEDDVFQKSKHMTSVRWRAHMSLRGPGPVVPSMIV